MPGCTIALAPFLCEAQSLAAVYRFLVYARSALSPNIDALSGNRAFSAPRGYSDQWFTAGCSERWVSATTKAQEHHYWCIGAGMPTPGMSGEG